MSAGTGTLPKRLLGRTGERVSCIGMGGFHIGKLADAAAATRLIHAAIDRGITFMDNSWDYNEGRSEEWMGQALQGQRDRVFLMTKVDGRDKRTAMLQLEESLRRLRTDHVDLWQFHEIIRSNDPHRIMAVDGAYQAALDAQRAGKIRFIGFTGHKSPEIHLDMLRVAAAHDWTPDTVQMPVNILDPHYSSFIDRVLPVLTEHNIGVLAMKTFGDHYVLDAVMKAKAATPAEMLRYSLSLPTSVVITGIDSMEILDQAVAAATGFTPMTSAEMADILARTRGIDPSGVHQPMKTTNEFDWTHSHPDSLGTGGELGVQPG